MVTKRGNGAQVEEIRLGKLQVAVWLGLAIGSIVGSYFVGFFSGRYVGFQSARDSSAVEVAKLPAPELAQDSSPRNPGGVYERLKAPAVLREAEELEELEGQPKGAVELDRAAESARAMAAPDVNERIAQAAPKIKVSASDLDSGDQIFADDGDGAGAELIIGSDEGLGRDTVPPSVRLLGENKAEPKIEREQVARQEAAAKVESSAAALLDERVSNAKAESAKEASAATAKKVNDVSASPLVKKVLPPGYFAQVAAPKKLAEAEGVAKRLKRSGFPVVIESTNVAGQSFYRVLVGPEDNKVQADRLVSQLKSESYVAGDPFIRKVK